MNALYPDCEPFKTEHVIVSDIHSIYLEQSGNPDGKPVIFLHGGPGNMSQPKHRKYFNPQKYRIILFDQRACGKSTPVGELKENTTWDLVEDMEKIRKHLGVEKWMVFGGSWGSTLALAYAEKYPQFVSELILRSIFLFRQSEIEWVFNGGAKDIFPDLWETYLKLLSKEERKYPLKSYMEKIVSQDPKIYKPAIQSASEWESSLSSLLPDLPSNSIENHLPTNKELEELFFSYKLFFHYINHNGFLKNEQLLSEVGKIRHIPGVILHGRYDMICPLASAWDLHLSWPEASFEIVPLAGHRAENTELIEKLVYFTDKFANNK